ncbi:ubiquitin-specific protease 13, partial [Tanacetum coccineum]
GLRKDKKKYKKSSKGNEVLQPNPSPNTKSSVRRLPKEVAKEKGPVKPKAAPVESNVSKRKRLVEDKEVEDERDSDVEGSDRESDSDKEHKGSEEADVSNESEEEGIKDVKMKVVKGKKKVVLLKFKKNEEVEADVEGNESEEDSESEEDKETEVSKESDDSEPGVKDVKIKGVKGNKTVVISKAKKRMHVSDSSSEEDKVSKPKKVSKKKQVKDVKKRKHVSDSSSYDDSSSSEEEKVLKHKKVSKKKRQVKDESSSSEDYDEKPLKNKKRSKHVKKLKKKKKKPLTAEQIMKIKYFNDLPNLRFRTVPSSLFAAMRDSQVDMESFLSDISASSYEFKLENGIIRVTPEKVYEILGVPLGGTFIFDLLEIPLDDPFVKEWFKQFDPKTLKKICACDIAEKLVLTITVDFMFKVNFLMLFANVMGTADTMKAIVNLTVLRSIREDTNIAEIDWCGFIHKSLQGSSELNIVVGFYIGSLCFLILLYLDSTKFDQFPIIRHRPAIRNWTTTAMNRRQELEIQEQVIGKLDLHGEWTESELDQTEGFYDVADIDDFDNNDDDGGGKNDDHDSDNVGKKKESAAKDVGKKDGVNAEKDGVNAVQEGEAHVNEEPEDMLEEETLT